MKQTYLTGIKPTGIILIGNYFGAIKPSIEATEKEDCNFFYFIADYHALTTVKSAKLLKEYTFDIACTYLACGLNPEKVVFYKQSNINQIFELSTILTNLTPKGLMNRAHAYKALVDKNTESGEDRDHGINMGLFNYPVLMAADILMFNATAVPVGQDQTQHVEIARDIANTFNKTYTNTFVLPKAETSKEVAVIVGQDGRKMSKSYGNTIMLFADESALKKNINKIVTDSRLPGEKKDTDNALCKLYKLFATEHQYAEFEKQLENGLAWGEAKKQLFEIANAYIAPMREKYNHFKQNPQLVEQILHDGAKKAQEIANETLLRAKHAIGAL